MARSTSDTEQLKLVAFDTEDLAIISAHLQDAVVKVGDLAYVPERCRFALLARRYDWETDGTEPRRCLTGLHFEHVLRCRTRGIDRDAPETVLNLLAVTFEGPDAPSGKATLVFAGDAHVELELDCIEARLKDLGPAWAARARPTHDLENT